MLPPPSVNDDERSHAVYKDFLAGKASGRMKGDRHLVAPKGTQLANAMLDLVASPDYDCVYLPGGTKSAETHRDDREMMPASRRERVCRAARAAGAALGRRA